MKISLFYPGAQFVRKHRKISQHASKQYYGGGKEDRGLSKDIVSRLFRLTMCILFSRVD